MNFKFLRRKQQKTELCPVCGGSGKVEGGKCHGCAGVGWLLTGDVSRSVNVNQNKNEAYDRNVNDIKIELVEGLDNSVAITVTGWDREQAFELFKRVRDEVKRK
jgi:RecJ-like exonuclease